MKTYATLLTWILCGITAAAVNLTPCPDCEQMVSPRAVMCPHCGCPGDAIKEAVAEREAEATPPPPKPVLQVTTDRATGYAVAFKHGEAKYVVMDAALLADTSSLGLSLLTTGENVAYQRMQIARDVPLVRFRIETDDLVFRSSSAASDNAPFAWLDVQGETTPASDGKDRPNGIVALLDADDNIAALFTQGGDDSYPIPEEREWRDVAPGAFREQMRLLSNASAAADANNLSEADIEVLNNTEWLSPFMANQARQVTTKAKEMR